MFEVEVRPAVQTSNGMPGQPGLRFDRLSSLGRAGLQVDEGQYGRQPFAASVGLVTRYVARRHRWGGRKLCRLAKRL